MSEQEEAELRLHWLKRALKTAEEERARLQIKLSLKQRDIERLQSRIIELETERQVGVARGD